jgi:sarcosine oxidase, subunit gamma
MLDLTAARSAPRFNAGRLLEPLPPLARYILRGGPQVRAAAEAVAGVGIPVQACRAIMQGERAALWLGPDEWLLIAPEAQAAALAGSLTGALSRLPHSLVDVSHRQSACELRGPQAATLLSAGCPLDLDESTFPVGMCTRTMLAKAEVVLWRTAAEAFRLEVWRSFVAYVSQFVAEAARASTPFDAAARS